MGICWYCHWGWPKAVREIYDSAVAKLGGDESPMEFGPGHVVWSDENFDDDNVAWCIAQCDDAGYLGRFTAGDIAIVKESLVSLAAVSLAERDPCPEDYDDENPESFPPPAGMEMIR